MPQIDLSYAQTRLAKLIQEAARGKEIIITQKDGWAFKIVPVQQPEQRPKFGSAKGLIRMSDDFDEPLEDFDTIHETAS